MKRIILKTKNGQDEKCKTYVYDNKTALAFYKITLITDQEALEEKVSLGTIFLKQTSNYRLILNTFSIKKSTLTEALFQLNLI